MIDISLFKKSIKVWIETNGNMILSKVSINGNTISKIQCVLEKDGTLLIGDITPFKKKSYYCKGYGSMMMAELLEYVCRKNIHTIIGNLSLVDREHKNRLHAFYIKNGFKVIEYDTHKDIYYGEVIKKL